VLGHQTPVVVHSVLDFPGLTLCFPWGRKTVLTACLRDCLLSVRRASHPVLPLKVRMPQAFP
jgi:hypothetical protein